MECPHFSPASSAEAAHPVRLSRPCPELSLNLPLLPFSTFYCSTLSKCCHAMVAVIYPFTWQHTYIPVLPPAMIDIVCSPTPFLIGLLTSSLPLLRELPLEEVSSGDIPVPFWWGPEGRGEVLAKAPQACHVRGYNPQACFSRSSVTANSVFSK